MRVGRRLIDLGTEGDVAPCAGTITQIVSRHNAIIAGTTPPKVNLPAGLFEEYDNVSSLVTCLRVPVSLGYLIERIPSVYHGP
jgi:hypothetical protein